MIEHVISACMRVPYYGIELRDEDALETATYRKQAEHLVPENVRRIKAYTQCGAFIGNDGRFNIEIDNLDPGQLDIWCYNRLISKMIQMCIFRDQHSGPDRETIHFNYHPRNLASTLELEETDRRLLRTLRDIISYMVRLVNAYLPKGAIQFILKDIWDTFPFTRDRLNTTQPDLSTIRYFRDSTGWVFGTLKLPYNPDEPHISWRYHYDWEWHKLMSVVEVGPWYENRWHGDLTALLFEQGKLIPWFAPVKIPCVNPMIVNAVLADAEHRIFYARDIHTPHVAVATLYAAVRLTSMMLARSEVGVFDGDEWIATHLWAALDSFHEDKIDRQIIRKEFDQCARMIWSYAHDRGVGE